MSGPSKQSDGLMGALARRFFGAPKAGGYVSEPSEPAAHAPQPWLPKPPPKNPSAAPGHQWHAMPGKRLELGNTGFCIELRELQTMNGKQMGYMAINPEGVACWSSLTDLPGLKKACEEQARYREEFNQ